MPGRPIRAIMTPSAEGWSGRIPSTGDVIRARTRGACLSALRRKAGPDAVLTVEVTPALAGVAEAAAILGWDKRRVITYVDRGSFPEPVAHLASGRVWRSEDVEAFARARARTASHTRTR
ncbi:MAG TPA: hypothetical protein VF984_12430 [Actinomycetota bacterium]